LDEAQQALDEFEEAHTGEGEALDGLEGSRGVTKGNVQDRVQELKDEALAAFDEGSPLHEQADAITKTNFGTREWKKGVDDPEGIFAELDVLYDYLSRYDDVSTRKSDLKDAKADLYNAVIDKYPELTEAEVKDLVVEDKWIATVEGAVQGEVERITQRLAGRVQELETRYAEPLPELENEVDALADNVSAHLETMGFSM
jgi:type I restriction enzyme M protein